MGFRVLGVFFFFFLGGGGVGAWGFGVCGGFGVLGLGVSFLRLLKGAAQGFSGSNVGAD